MAVFVVHSYPTFWCFCGCFCWENPVGSYWGIWGTWKFLTWTPVLLQLEPVVSVIVVIFIEKLLRAQHCSRHSWKYRGSPHALKILKNTSEHGETMEEGNQQYVESDSMDRPSIKTGFRLNKPAFPLNSYFTGWWPWRFTGLWPQSASSGRSGPGILRMGKGVTPWDGRKVSQGSNSSAQRSPYQKGLSNKTRQ